MQCAYLGSKSLVSCSIKFSSLLAQSLLSVLLAVFPVWAFQLYSTSFDLDIINLKAVWKLTWMNQVGNVHGTPNLQKKEKVHHMWFWKQYVTGTISTLNVIKHRHLSRSVSLRANVVHCSSTEVTCVNLCKLMRWTVQTEAESRLAWLIQFHLVWQPMAVKF